MSNTKKIVLAVVIVMVLATIVALYIVRNEAGQVVQQDQALGQQKALVEKTNIDFAKTPEKFPSDVPLEKDATITQNYNATTPEGGFQATRAFQTKQTLAANYKLYSDYLKNNGWEVKASLDQPKFKMVMGTKGNQQLLISIDENNVTAIKTVSIYLTETK